MAVRNKVLYEQSLWDREHVESINTNLRGIIIPDGEWHSYPQPHGNCAWYRVVDEKYFQAVYAKRSNRTLEALMSILPVETKDDTEWTIWKERDGYGISSVFAITPGPFGHTREVAQWLDRHSLGFKDDKAGLRGVAYFADIERGCLADAMQRLAWLESVFLSLNQKFEELGKSFWEDIKTHSDEIYNRVKGEIDVNEIIPVPVAFRPQGYKYRQPI